MNPHSVLLEIQPKKHRQPDNLQIIQWFTLLAQF